MQAQTKQVTQATQHSSPQPSASGTQRSGPQPSGNVAALCIAGLLLWLPAPLHAASSGVIALYHHVAENTPRSTSISPAAFRGHLEYLRDNGFNVIGLNEMVTTLRAGGELPDRAVAITFDDGYASIYDTAFPMLREFGMPFTLFLSTEPINNNQRGYMSWDDVREMAEAGAIIANHTVTHLHMLERKADNGEETEARWLARLRDEVLQAERRIEAETGQAWRYFAYPYGEYNPAIQSMLAELGFTAFAQSSGAMGHGSDYLALPRFPLAGIYANLNTAKTKLATLAFAVERIDPVSPVTHNPSPGVTLRLQPGDYSPAELNCFADGESFPPQWLDRQQGLLRLAPEATFSSRRWLYTCTARAKRDGSPRYFWHAVQWINPAVPE